MLILYSLFNDNKDLVTKYSNRTNKIFYDQIDSNQKSKENIYYFILDGMTSLKYFNESFPEKKDIFLNHYANYLKSNNYTIHQNTQSNYNSTYLSMAALLSLDYPVTDLSDKYFGRANFWPYLMTNPNKKPRLISILEENDMSFKWYGNITASCKNYSYDKNFCPKDSVSNFFYVFNSFFKKTPLITFLRKFFPKFMLAGYGASTDTINNFLNDFDNLDISKKKFYLIHHLAPHPPYIHNSDCSLKDKSLSFVTDNNYGGYKDSYLCALKRIEQAVKMLSEKDPKSLVVFTADHGWILKDKDNLKNKQMLKFDIFNAFKINEKCKQFISNKIDAISTIRLVLGCNINREPVLTNGNVYQGYQENNRNFGKIFKVF